MKYALTMLLSIVISAGVLPAHSVYSANVPELSDIVLLECSPLEMKAVVSTEALVSGSDISVVIYPKDASGLSEIIYANAESIEDPGEKLSFYYKFKEKDPETEYTLRISYFPDNDTSYDFFYTWTRISEEKFNDIMERFRTVDRSGFDELYIKAVQGRYINTDDIENAENLGKYYVDARRGYADGAFGDTFREITTSKELETVIKTAVLLREIQSGTSASLKESLKKYYGLLPDVFPKEPKYDNFVSVFNIRQFSGINEMTEAMKLAYALSEMKNASYAAVESVVIEYADVLGIDLNALSRNNISTIEFAKELDNSIPSSYLDGLRDEQRGIIAAIQSKKPSSYGGGGGGGGGGGSGGAGFSTSSKSPDPIIQNYGHTDPVPLGEKSDADKLPFTDLSNHDWATDAITKLYLSGAIDGVTETSFEPDRHITREEYIKILVLALDLRPFPESMMYFSDCPKTFWAYPYIDSAYSNSVVQGRDDGTFGVGEKILRQDVAVICGNVLKSRNIGVPVSADETRFVDMEEVGDYAKSYVLALSSTGIIEGYPDGGFMPLGNTTRAEAVVIIQRLIDYIGG